LKAACERSSTLPAPGRRANCGFAAVDLGSLLCKWSLRKIVRPRKGRDCRWIFGEGCFEWFFVLRMGFAASGRALKVAVEHDLAFALGLGGQ